jgi:NAD(P)H-dependent flavin oxidoreductase YrpB (nitropropane dioxygenase family)
MTLTTELCERIGIEHPVMQSGMGGIGPMTLAPLAAAISNAGGLGTIAHPALLLETPGEVEASRAAQIERVVEQVRGGIREAASLTDNPFAINVRIAAEQPDAEAVLEAILEERERDSAVHDRLRVLTTSGGHPRVYGMNERFQEAGMLRFHAVSTVRQAQVAKDAGVDAVVATGFEAAGHVGHVPVHTFVLVPGIAHAVDVPIVCAGGVADGRSLAGALVLGAELGYMGTRFLAAAECEYHDNMKRYIIEKRETDTEVVPAFFGPARFLKSGFTEVVRDLDARGVDPLERMKVEGEALRRSALEGDVESGMMIGGQSAGRVEEVLPAAEIVRQVVAEAEEALGRVERFRRATRPSAPR